MKTKSKFRLFKRDDTGHEMDPSAPGYKDRYYYFRFTHRGRAYPRCLETADATEAHKRARAKYAEIVAAVSSGEYKRLDATKLRHEATTQLTQLYTAYRSGPSQANAATREQNIHALEAIAGAATHLQELTPALVRRWFETVTTKCLDEPDQQQAASLKRSANSRWAKASSLFTAKCLAHYQDLELLGHTGRATLEAFVNAGNLAEFTRIPKVFYNPPSDAIIKQTFADWEAIQERDLFLAIGHELAFGLRISEFAQAKWSWHTTRAGYPVLDGHATVKSGTGYVQVRALDPWFTTMKRIATANKWWPEDSAINSQNSQLPDSLIITGTDAYRTDAIFRAVSDWLRQRGWETRKTNHALRAYAGSQVAMKYGIYEAQIWLRHSTVKVTEQNYSHFVSKFKPSDLNSIAARWAVAGAKVTSNVPDVTLDATSDFRKTPLDSTTVIPWKIATRN